MLKKVYQKSLKMTHHKHAIPFFGFIFFAEAIFLFAPVGTILTLLCTEHRNRAYFFATLALVATTLGGIIAYCLGFFFWDAIGANIIMHIISQQTFDSIVLLYKKHQNMIIFFGSFAPVPYKAITLSSGFFGVPFGLFLLLSIFSRGLKFYFIATLGHFYGKQVRDIIDKWFYVFVMLSCCLVLAYLGSSYINC